MIEVKNVKKEFKKTIKDPGLKGSVKSLFHKQTEIVTAVEDVSFSVPKGDILGFIGPNGAGKSTVIKMLTGILRPTSGTILINGQVPFKNRKNYVKDIGVVFGQRSQLWWDLPLTETFTILKEVYRVDEKKYQERLDFLNEVLDLKSFMTSPVRTLSLGQRMRGDIAASMLHNPKVLFLDEPTIGLDVVVKDNIRKAIQEINRVEKTTIILTTHDLDDIETLCEHIVMIDKGTMVYDGPLATMKQKFNQIREVNFTLFSPSDYNNLHILEHFHLNEDDLEIETNHDNLNIKFNVDKVAVSDLVSYILQTISVKDMSVNDIDIEDIIMHVFRNEEVPE